MSTMTVPASRGTMPLVYDMPPPRAMTACPAAVIVPTALASSAVVCGRTTACAGKSFV